MSSFTHAHSFETPDRFEVSTIVKIQVVIWVMSAIFENH
jgi:hypothetical protein